MFPKVHGSNGGFYHKETKPKTSEDAALACAMGKWEPPLAYALLLKLSSHEWTTYLLEWFSAYISFAFPEWCYRFLFLKWCST